MSWPEYLQRWRELHGNANPGRVVRGWLVIAFGLARPLAAVRTPPDLISFSGVLAAIAAWWLAVAGHPISAAIVIVTSLILDGLDGAVAVLRRRESAWGGVLDSLLDRVSEAVWAGTLVVIGVPMQVALAGWTAAMVQEYQRARFASLARSDAPIRATICERPVRALLIASSVLMSQNTLPLSDRLTPTVFAAAWLVLQTIGATQAWLAARVLRA